MRSQIIFTSIDLNRGYPKHKPQNLPRIPLVLTNSYSKQAIQFNQNAKSTIQLKRSNKKNPKGFGTHIVGDPVPHRCQETQNYDQRAGYVARSRLLHENRVLWSS